MSIEKQSSVQAGVGVHNGRPVVMIDGVPKTLPIYSPRGWDHRHFLPATRRFFPHKMGAYFLAVSGAKNANDFFATPFWIGDRISSQPLDEEVMPLDEQARAILDADPDTHFILRYGPHEPKSWRDLHSDDLFVTETGKQMDSPSLASRAYWEASARFGQAVVEYVESRPWSSRVIGYWFGLRGEGTHLPVFQRWLFDHSLVMRRRWRAFLQEKYQTIENLRAAHQNQTITFDTSSVPVDKLRGNAFEVSQSLYFQTAEQNQPLRDYLQLSRDLFHAGFRDIIFAMHDVLQRLDRKRFVLYDALKQSMQGWDIENFFNQNESSTFVYPELMAGSGHMNVSEILDDPKLDGLITPHDYQARGIGGWFEPEGAVDSTVLRGKYFLCEMDTRTYCGKDHYGRAENDKEFAAITWRNLAASLTRGFNSYWMDLHEDWFATDSLHAIIEPQVRVIEQSVNWPHADVPGIAMVLDDSCILETDGRGNVLQEAVMWEQKTGLARCGVPYRIYLLQDLDHPSMPDHRVYYFPNLYHVDDRRLDLLRRKVMTGGKVAVWGPGSGISDGSVISPESARRLTGFDFNILNVNYARRVIVTNFDHPITRDLPADTLYGSPTAYGPVLFPRGGTSLGMAWTKQGRAESGISVKDMGEWTSLFTTAALLPADLWRGIARFAKAHVYCDENDIVLADQSIVGLHSVKSGDKVIHLPRPAKVHDLVSGKVVGSNLTKIELAMTGPETRVFRLEL